MSQTTSVENAPIEGSELRQRLPQDPSVPRQAYSAEAAKKTVLDLNAAESEGGKAEKDKRTYGRTPDGTVFTVPHTHDMVSQLLSPTQPKNFSDVIVLVVLAVHILALVALPRSASIPLFAVVFLFWRTCYNGGIGYLLNEQSHYKSMVEWAKRSKIFENPETGKNPRPGLYKLLKREMETKIPKDYKFENAPLEYNTWLLFRRVVDLVLMCDFTSYCLFAIACGGRPAGESVAMTLARWAAGILLVLFNLWVKLDAHRVVKDYAWYWGDFFYLIDQELTFDGVFEMAPHPMYSVGYAGFYGISLMAASYKVLFISIIAHAAQFAFLSLVENPHIDKTYNPPPPRTQVPDAPPALGEMQTSVQDLDGSLDSLSPPLSPVQSKSEPPPMRNLLGVQNIDLHRVTDVAAFLLQGYLYTLAIFTPSTLWYNTFFILNAVFWRLWYSVGIGILLICQSDEKSWTRHFIKYGETSAEAWRQWKGVYHISMTMCYVSFIVASVRMYSLPSDWEVGMALLRHVLGAAMIALQLWTVASIYESLGEFGWFFGDFFFDNSAKLTYGGIYRFLNNPERVIGLAGVWGCAIITWSKAIFFLALLSHVLTLAFIQFVEKPHMEKRYGQTLRQQSGVSKTFTRSMPPKIRQWQGSVDKVFDETVDFIEEFIESARPKLASGVDTIVKDTKNLFRKYPARLSITRLAPDLQGFEPKEYSIEFEGTPALDNGDVDKASGREGEIARTIFDEGKVFQPAALEYGAPIKVKWTAPLHHSKHDWIGLYMVADNSSKDATVISSQGRWVATNKGAFDSSPRADQGILVSDKQHIKWENERGQACMIGEMEFSGDKLWWTTGIFEFRYHHDGKHNVMAVSKPFELRVGRFVESLNDLDPSGGYRTAIEKNLLRIVRNCFDRDPEVAPNTVEEGFGGLVERDGKFAKRVVFAVKQMFGIEFATEVVKADGNVRNLAWRIYNAKQVLAPYSMSSQPGSQGHSTPTDEKQ